MPLAERVHDAPRIQRLLAPRLAAVVHRIEDLHNEFLRPAASQVWSNVITERIIPALMDANALAVDIYLRLPIHRVQMQNDTLPAPARRHRESPPIPRPRIELHYPRDGRFHRKRRQDAGRQGLIGRNRVAVGHAGLKLPDAVEAEPVAPHHLRTRILRQRIIGIHQAGPRRHQRGLFHLPGAGLAADRKGGRAEPGRLQPC